MHEANLQCQYTLEPSKFTLWAYFTSFESVLYFEFKYAKYWLTWKYWIKSLSTIIHKIFTVSKKIRYSMNIYYPDFAIILSQINNDIRIADNCAQLPTYATTWRRQRLISKYFTPWSSQYKSYNVHVMNDPPHDCCDSDVFS